MTRDEESLTLFCLEFWGLFSSVVINVELFSGFLPSLLIHEMENALFAPKIYFSDKNGQFLVFKGRKTCKINLS